MTKAERRRINPGDDLILPSGLVWSVADWCDFYRTLTAFNARVRKRHATGSLQDREGAEVIPLHGTELPPDSQG